MKSSLTFCNDPGVLKALNVALSVAKILLILAPLVLMIKMMIDIFKSVTTTEDNLKELVGKYFQKFFICVTIFFIPTIVSSIFSIVEKSTPNISSNLKSCIKNTSNIEYFEALAAKEQEAEKAKYKDKVAKQNAKAKEEKSLIMARSAKLNSSSSSSSGSNPDNTGQGGNVVGQRYNLTEAQLRGLALVCQREQGTVVGAKAEASLMANRFELFGSKYGSGGTGLYNYVAKSGWFSQAGKYMQNTSGLRSDIYAAVKEVLVYGNRTLPPYVDEHDCIDCGRYGFDVRKIVTNGNTITNHAQLKNHGNYYPNQTVIYNRYGSVYTFYTFPTPSSDPFGYTQSALNRYNQLRGGK